MTTPISANELRDLIADSIAAHLKSYEVAGFCVRLGLLPAGSGENPFSSKRVYVRGRLLEKSLADLQGIAQAVAEEFGDEGLAQKIGFGGQRGVDGELKNIIFASVGPKPRIVMQDAINNVIDIVENVNSCLIYDQPLRGAGLTWGELATWWGTKTGVSDAPHKLYQRLHQSLDSEPEKLLFREYCKRYGQANGADVPALLPQVYLHYDPYLRMQRRHTPGEIKRERMDFLLLFPNRARVVIEVDGKQHYSDAGGAAAPTKYAIMVAEDRKLRLKGYEVFRFGGAEFMRKDSQTVLSKFFDELLELHSWGA